jgi:hypothetical protein
MTKVEILSPAYENLTEMYINARNRAGASILEMANICLKAKTQLKKKQWLQWLDDNRIGLKRTQAKKLIAIAQNIQGGQSTDLLNKKGVEETYLITRISDNFIRDELAGQIIEADFTVKQTRQAVKLVSDNQKTPCEAVEAIKSGQMLPTSTVRKSVPLVIFIIICVLPISNTVALPS